MLSLANYARAIAAHEAFDDACDAAEAQHEFSADRLYDQALLAQQANDEAMDRVAAAEQNLPADPFTLPVLNPLRCDDDCGPF